MRIGDPDRRTRSGIAKGGTTAGGCRRKSTSARLRKNRMRNQPSGARLERSEFRGRAQVARAFALTVPRCAATDSTRPSSRSQRRVRTNRRDGMRRFRGDPENPGFQSGASDLRAATTKLGWRGERCLKAFRGHRSRGRTASSSKGTGDGKGARSVWTHCLPRSASLQAVLRRTRSCRRGPSPGSPRRPAELIRLRRPREIPATAFAGGGTEARGKRSAGPVLTGPVQRAGCVPVEASARGNRDEADRHRSLSWDSFRTAHVGGSCH